MCQWCQWRERSCAPTVCYCPAFLFTACQDKVNSRGFRWACVNLGIGYWPGPGFIGVKPSRLTCDISSCLGTVANKPDNWMFLHTGGGPIRLNVTSTENKKLVIKLSMDYPTFNMPSQLLCYASRLIHQQDPFSLKMGDTCACGHPTS